MKKWTQSRNYLAKFTKSITCLDTSTAAPKISLNIFQTAVMSTAYPLPSNLSPATVANTASLLRIVALGLISAAGIASRLFAVINFESIIHELYAVPLELLCSLN